MSERDIQAEIKKLREEFNTDVVINETEIKSLIQDVKNTHKDLVVFLEGLAREPLPSGYKFAFEFLGEVHALPRVGLNLLFLYKNGGAVSMKYFDIDTEDDCSVMLDLGDDGEGIADGTYFYPQGPDNIELVKKDITDWFVYQVAANFDESKINPMVVDSSMPHKMG